MSKSDSIMVASTYTNNAEILNNNQPSTIGHAAIVSFYGDMILSGITGASFATKAVWGTDDLVIEEGTGYFSLSSGKVIEKGRYLLVCKREDGKLKIFKDTFFSDGKLPKS